MKTNKNQLDNSYTINVDDETSKLIEAIAEHEQRKPRELLRLLLKPALLNKWAEIQRQEHPENESGLTVAKFQA